MYNNISKLKDLSTYDEIISPNKALLRGMHCPLFGYTILMQYISDMAYLIIGSEECAYYSKDILKVIDNKNFLESPVYNYCIEDLDIVYGFSDSIIESIHTIIEECRPNAICLISTCIPELIGEDIEAIPAMLKDEINIPIIYCKAHNFEFNSHVDGMADLLLSFIDLMDEKENKNGVNFLGGRNIELEKTEIYKWITDSNIKVQSTIPNSKNVAEIRNASSAKLNIVIDETGLKLAKEMKRTLNIDYVVFASFIDPIRIYNSYTEIKKILNIDFNEELKQKYIECTKIWDKWQAPKENNKIVFISSSFITMEFCKFLDKKGFDIKSMFLIHKNEIDEYLFHEAQNMNSNPYIMMLTDFSWITNFIKEFTPNFVFGMVNEALKEEYKFATISSRDIDILDLGFSKSIAMFKSITKEVGGKYGII